MHDSSVEGAVARDSSDHTVAVTSAGGQSIVGFFISPETSFRLAGQHLPAFPPRWLEGGLVGFAPH